MLIRPGLISCNLLALISALSVSAVAQAQTVDYQSLETLFGEAVTTSASGKPQKASEAPVSLEIITNEQIRRSGVTSIPEIINRVTGVTSWQATRNTADIGIRGQNSANNPTLLVLLNGRQVYSDVYGYTEWELIPVQLNEIYQIEIVKGPASALYGFNASAGVVNIITYNPKYNRVNQVSGTVGTGAMKAASGITTISTSDKMNVRVSGSHQGNDESEKNSPTLFAAGSRFTHYNTNNKLLADSVVQLADKTDLRIETSYSDAFNSQPFKQYQALPVDKHSYSAKATLTTDTENNGLIEGNIYFNSLHESNNRPSSSDIVNQVAVVQLQDLFKINTDHTLRLQAEARHNSLVSDSLIGPANAEVYYNTLASGVMWDWAMRPGFEWTNAVRIDSLFLNRDGAFNAGLPFNDNAQFDRDIFGYSANSGLVWKASDNDIFRASYARGIQAPSLLGFGLQNAINGNLILAGNPGLNPTIQKNYELSYDRKLDPISGNLTATTFYRTTENIQTLGATQSTALGITTLSAGWIGASATRGLELGMKGKIGDSWLWNVGYTYQNTVDEIAANSQTSVQGLAYDDMVPHHVVQTHLGYTHGPWEADANSEYGSSFKALTLPLASAQSFTVAPIESYYSLSARAAYNFEDGYIVALEGSNLLTPGVNNNYGLRNQRHVFLVATKKF